MEVAYTFRYEARVVEEDIPALTKTARIRIREAIEAKLTTRPEVFGKPLRKSLAGYRKLRVGDYRVIFRITGRQVLVFAINHRRDVYRTANKHS